MLESFQDIIVNYGYYAVFFFACIEGELALITAGFLCKHGYLSLPGVILVAFTGTVIFEQIVFLIGRQYGTRILNKFPKIKKTSYRVMAFLRKYNTSFIFIYRFIYGIRNISPLIIGMARVPRIRYTVLNIIASIIWASSVAGFGYCFASVLEVASTKLQFAQKLLLLLIVSILISGFFVYKIKKSKKQTKI